MGIYEKLIDIQNELKAPKNQYNSFGKYNYRSCEDILEGLKPVLKKHKATLFITDDIAFIGNRFYVKAIAKLTDAESGESVTNSAYARESDVKKGMDDSQVTGATSSYARKYALNGLFLIDDTKDADTDEFKSIQDNAPKQKQTTQRQTQPKQEPQPAPQQNTQSQQDEIDKQLNTPVDPDMLVHGEGMTPRRLAKLKKAQEFTGKNDKTILATAHATSFEAISEVSYVSVMELFLKLLTPEQKAEIEAIQ